MKKILLFLAVLLLCLAYLPTAVFAAEVREYSWYCSKERLNGQMRLPSEFSFLPEHGGYFVDTRHGADASEKVLYLTFDAGYENGNVAKTLDILKETDTPAAFFVLKHLAVENADLLRRMKAEGHLICNHTASHKNLSRATPAEIKAEIEALSAAVADAVGEGTSSYFRPPEGRFSREMLAAVHALGYRTVFWSVAYADWDNAKQKSPKTALDTLTSRVHNGAVILLHPTSATNVAILREFIEKMKAEGYRFASLDELCIER